MTSPYIEYYLNQAGSGLSAFEGVRYQRGGGFFGRLLSGAILPALRFLGKKAFGTGMDIGNDVFLRGKDFKRSLKRRGKDAAIDVAETALKRVKRFAQTGEGYKGIKRCYCDDIKRPVKRRRIRKRKRKTSKTIKKKVGTKKTKKTQKVKKTKRKSRKGKRPVFDFLK